MTFSCYRRQARFIHAGLYRLFVDCLEEMRCRFDLRVYGYVVMPEHVHLLLSEPGHGTLADAIHYLKLSFSKRLPGLGETVPQGVFWQKRYYDRNVRNNDEFTVKLRYLHRNPVKRGLVSDPQEWPWSSYRHYALREVGRVEIESGWTAVDRERTGPTRIFLRPG